MQQGDQSVRKRREYDDDPRLIEGNVNFKILHYRQRAQRSRWMCDALSSQVFLFSGFLKMITKIQDFFSTIAHATLLFSQRHTQIQHTSKCYGRQRYCQVHADYGSSSTHNY